MPVLAAILVTAVLGAAAFAQSLGSVEVAGRVKIGTANERLKRKRFYLFRGGLAENRQLVDKLKTSAAPASRDCFYCSLGASAEYIAWLKSEDCESPFCRAIGADDVAKVPEFKSAYQKGLQQFKNKPDLARNWLTVNLPAPLRNGFYMQRKSVVDSLLKGATPLQTSMTDSVSVVAPFIDIPLAASTAEMFLVTNVVPFELGGKTYLWVCEVKVDDKKRAKLSLNLDKANKPAGKCEVVVRDVAPCAGNCGTK